MSRNPIYLPAHSPEDWRLLLADPALHWERERSAQALAYSWHLASGVPTAPRAALEPTLGKFEVLCAFPEYEVPLPGGTRASQTDLMVIGRASDGALVVVAVEGKVAESLGPTVEEWLVAASEGKKARLKYLCELLALDMDALDEIRYQLLHRTASALLTAEKFGASTAVMLIHSFSPDKAWFDDYAAFSQLLGVEPADGTLSAGINRNGCELRLGWVTDSAPKVGTSTRINTFSGGQIDYASPRAHDIRIEDIAAGLAKVCRFGAQALTFYSVAQHAVAAAQRVQDRGRPDLALAALHHDSHEAYMSDIPTPLKRLLQPSYGAIADGLDHAISKHLSVKPPKKDSADDQLIKAVDEDLLLEEAHHLLPDGGAAIAQARAAQPFAPTAGAPPLDAWPPDTARQRFLETHEELS